MNTINYELLKHIKAKLALGISLNSFERAYYTLYGDRLSAGA